MLSSRHRPVQAPPLPPRREHNPTNVNVINLHVTPPAAISCSAKPHNPPPPPPAAPVCSPFFFYCLRKSESVDKTKRAGRSPRGRPRGLCAPHTADYFLEQVIQSDDGDGLLIERRQQEARIQQASLFYGSRNPVKSCFPRPQCTAAATRRERSCTRGSDRSTSASTVCFPPRLLVSRCHL